MALKSLAVFVEPSDAGESRVRYAVKLAMQHGAHLIGVFIVPRTWENERADYIRGASAIREMVERHNAAERAALLAVGQKFEALAGRDSYSFEFRVIGDGDTGELARLNCLHTDLVIVGHPSPGGLPRQWSPEQMLIATGVPMIILPQEWRHEAIATNILLAWNASREARRAITDSLAILKAARSVSIVVIDAEKTGLHGQEPGADIAHFLSRHGVRARVEQLRSEGSAIADVIIRYAAEDRSDLIVLGAYSRSRNSELLFGGVTRSMLSAVTIPTLIAH